MVLKEYSKNASRQKAEIAFRLAIYNSSEEEKDGGLLTLLCSCVYSNAVTLSVDDAKLMMWNISEFLRGQLAFPAPKRGSVYNKYERSAEATRKQDMNRPALIASLILLRLLRIVSG